MRELKREQDEIIAVPDTGFLLSFKYRFHTHTHSSFELCFQNVHFHINNSAAQKGHIWVVVILQYTELNFSTFK